MKYCLVEEGSITFIGNLPASWRNVSGLNLASPEHLKELGWFPFEEVNPEYNPATQYLSEPVNDIQESKVVATKTVLQKMEEQIQTEAQQIIINKRFAYKSEADQLYIEWQVLLAKSHPDAEARRLEWIAKRAEIQARFADRAD